MDSDDSSDSDCSYVTCPEYIEDDDCGETLDFGSRFTSLTLLDIKGHLSPATIGTSVEWITVAPSTVYIKSARSMVSPRSSREEKGKLLNHSSTTLFYAEDARNDGDFSMLIDQTPYAAGYLQATVSSPNVSPFTNTLPKPNDFKDCESGEQKILDLVTSPPAIIQQSAPENIGKGPEVPTLKIHMARMEQIPDCKSMRDTQPVAGVSNDAVEMTSQEHIHNEAAANLVTRISVNDIITSAAKPWKTDSSEQNDTTDTTVEVASLEKSHNQATSLKANVLENSSLILASKPCTAESIEHDTNDDVYDSHTALVEQIAAVEESSVVQRPRNKGKGHPRVLAFDLSDSDDADTVPNIAAPVRTKTEPATSFILVASGGPERSVNVIPAVSPIVSIRSRRNTPLKPRVLALDSSSSDSDKKQNITVKAENKLEDDSPIITRVKKTPRKLNLVMDSSGEEETIGRQNEDISVKTEDVKTEGVKTENDSPIITRVKKTPRKLNLVIDSSDEEETMGRHHDRIKSILEQDDSPIAISLGGLLDPSPVVRRGKDKPNRVLVVSDSEIENRRLDLNALKISVTPRKNINKGSLLCETPKKKQEEEDIWNPAPKSHLLKPLGTPATPRRIFLLN